MKARYAGYCRPGDDRIRPGDEVSRYPRVGWAHPRCHAEATRPALVGNAALAAAERYGYADGGGDPVGDWERVEARRERERMDAEYAAGVEDARRERFNRDMFGEAYAAAEEYARDMAGLNGEW